MSVHILKSPALQPGAISAVLNVKTGTLHIMAKAGLRHKGTLQFHGLPTRFRKCSCYRAPLRACHIVEPRAVLIPEREVAGPE